MFDERKVAQAAAFLVQRAGGRIPLIKLMKLLYLADRESLARHAHPISYDRMVSMDHGPVLSRTLNLANGAVPSSPDGWEYWISDREHHAVAINREVDPGALVDLSEADLEILDHVWRSFGHMTKWEIVEFTHKNLPEWTDPDGSSLQIGYEDVFIALGQTPEAAEQLASDLFAHNRIARKLA